MYKSTIILGTQAVKEFTQTSRINKNTDGGKMKRVQFQTKAEYEAYCKGIIDAIHMDGYKFIPDKNYSSTVICTRCGETNVTCEGIVNPNSGQSLELVKEAFYNGNCEKCGWVILSNVKEALTSILKAKKEFRNKTNKKFTYAECEITYCDASFDDNNKAKRVIFKLNPFINKENDDYIFFYCQNLKELISFVHPDKGREFVILKCISIF